MAKLFNTMLDKGIEHFNKEVPVMQLTEEGYVDSGMTQSVWKSSDVAAFTGLLKLAEYKHIDGMSGSAEGMRDALSTKRAAREAARKARGGAPDMADVGEDNVLPLVITVGM